MKLQDLESSPKNTVWKAPEASPRRIAGFLPPSSLDSKYMFWLTDLDGTTRRMLWREDGTMSEVEPEERYAG